MPTDENMQPQVNMDTPSDFNIFKDSLKPAFDQIYADTKLVLPSLDTVWPNQ